MRRLPRFNWSELPLPGLIALGETAAVALWLPLIAAIAGHGTFAPHPAGLFVIGLAAYWLSRPGVEEHGPLLTRRTTLGVWLILTAGWLILSAGLPLHTATIVEGWVVLLLAVVAWLRGASLAGASDLTSPDRAHRLLGYGVLLIGMALLLSLTRSGPERATVQHAARWAAPLMVLSGLLLSALGVSSVVEGRPGSSVKRQRASATVLAAGLFLLAAFVVLLASGNANWVIDGLHSAVTAVAIVAFWAIAGVAYAVFYVITGIAWILGITFTFPKLPFHLFSQPAPRNGQQQATPLWQEALFIAAATFVASLLIRWYMPKVLTLLMRRRERAGVQVVRGAIRSDGSLLADVRDLISGLGLGRRSAQRVDLHSPPVSVRDAYRKLLVLSAREGQRLRSTESPRDFATRLGIAWVDLSGSVDELTGRYVADRYGEISTAEDLAAASQAWHQIHQAFAGDEV